MRGSQCFHLLVNQLDHTPVRHLQTAPEIYITITTNNPIKNQISVADLNALVLDARLGAFRLHGDVLTLSTSSEAAPTKGAIPMASFSNDAAIVKASACMVRHQ